MRIAFVHQNMPGQFGRLARALATDPANEVVFVTRRGDAAIEGVRSVPYAPHRGAAEGVHHYLRTVEDAVLHGQAVVRAFEGLARMGFTPDLIVAHPAWGEAMFLKDVFPRVPLACYAELYATPGDAPLDVRLHRRVQNAPQLLSLEACDVAWSPTHWQRASFPTAIRDKIEVVFDGVELDAARPDPGAHFTLPSGRDLQAGEPVVTYIARGLEAQRGFPQFARALPELLARRPDAQVVIAGEDRCFYSPPPNERQTWREAMAAEVGFDPERVHFTGWLDRAAYLSLLQVSAVHAYLSVPFTLSWSFFDAMAAGCLVLGSQTAPVLEVLKPGVNGLGVALDDPSALADALAQALEHPDAPALRAAARATIAAGYDAPSCLARQMEILRRVMG